MCGWKLGYSGEGMKHKYNPVMNSFGGIIIQTITQTNDARFYVGQVFSGYYQYDSTLADGVFHVANTQPPAGNRTLKGLIYLPFSEDKARMNSLPSTMNDGSLTVSGNVVTAFAWSFDNGGFYTSFTVNSFQARHYGRIDPLNGNHLPDMETKGTVMFSAPLRQS